MIRLVQHVPNYCEGFRPNVVEVATQAELLATPWVAAYAADVEPVEREGVVSEMLDGRWHNVRVIHPAPDAQRFHRFSLSERHLMVEHNDGIRHRVVGTITHGLDELTLPRWEEHPEARKRREAWNRGDTGPPPKPYRCAEHGTAWANCCLKTRHP